MERLDFRTAKLDRTADSLRVKGKKVEVEIAREVLETAAKKPLDELGMTNTAIIHAKTFNRLANVIPADDGKINITLRLFLEDGQFGSTKNDN